MPRPAAHSPPPRWCPTPPLSAPSSRTRDAAPKYPSSLPPVSLKSAYAPAPPHPSLLHPHHARHGVRSCPWPWLPQLNPNSSSPQLPLLAVACPLPLATAKPPPTPLTATGARGPDAPGWAKKVDPDTRPDPRHTRTAHGLCKRAVRGAEREPRSLAGSPRTAPAGFHPKAAHGSRDPAGCHPQTAQGSRWLAPPGSPRLPPLVVTPRQPRDPAGCHPQAAQGSRDPAACHPQVAQGSRWLSPPGSPRLPLVVTPGSQARWLSPPGSPGLQLVVTPRQPRASAGCHPRQPRVAAGPRRSLALRGVHKGPRWRGVDTQRCVAGTPRRWYTGCHPQVLRGRGVRAHAPDCVGHLPHALVRRVPQRHYAG